MTTDAVDEKAPIEAKDFSQAFRDVKSLTGYVRGLQAVLDILEDPIELAKAIKALEAQKISQEAAVANSQQVVDQAHATAAKIVADAAEKGQAKANQIISDAKAEQAQLVAAGRTHADNLRAQGEIEAKACIGEGKATADTIVATANKLVEDAKKRVAEHEAKIPAIQAEIKAHQDRLEAIKAEKARILASFAS